MVLCLIIGLFIGVDAMWLLPAKTIRVRMRPGPTLGRLDDAIEAMRIRKGGGRCVSVGRDDLSY